MSNPSPIQLADTLIRPVEPADADGLRALAADAGFGFTSLTPEPAHIQRRIEASLAGEQPLLVMTPRPSLTPSPNLPALLGCAGLTRSTGKPDTAEPFYAYRRERTIHQSPRLAVRNEVEALHLVAEYDGPTLLGTLILHPAARGQGLGRALSLARFLLIARDPQRFRPTLIAELRGIIDRHGVSPFWEGLGRHFFHVDYATADRLSAQDKRFIAELMPQHPIYLPLLPPEAQQAVGQVHDDTRPAMKLLESEGFYLTPLVDIFDAGPVLRCDAAAVRTVRQARHTTATLADPAPASANTPALIATTQDDLRIVAQPIDLSTTTTALDPRTAEALAVEPDAPLIVSPLRDPAANTSA
ncbi:MAG: arginine N-succinyltransferase [Planctomycetota bacterium]